MTGAARTADEGTGTGVRVTIAAAISMALSIMPAFLLASLGIFVRPELGFSEQRLAMALAVFFSVTALVSAPGGRLGERIGAYRAVIGAGCFSTVSMLGIGLVATDWPVLIGFLAVGGLGNSLGQSSTNLALARGVARRRQGLAFGIKQAAGPVTTVMGGAAVPLLGLTVGWRWAMVLGPVFLLMLLLSLPRNLPGAAPSGSRRRAPRSRAPLRHLVLLAVAAGFGGAAANGMIAFLVESSANQGMTTGTAGVVLAMGSLAAVALRVLSGVVADRRRDHRLTPVAILMAVGCAGYLLLAFGSSAVVIFLGSILAFGAGWGWPGLFVLGVVSQNRGAPAAATGIAQTGFFAGAVVGPLVFATTLSLSSYRSAWLAMATLCGIAAGLVLHADRRF